MPNLAMEAHRDAMDGTLQEALQQAGLSAQDLDAVAVTIGPGLSLCLKVKLLWRDEQAVFERVVGAPGVRVHMHMRRNVLL